ncbi:MAG: LacI family DNA-binding transcriptional regulator [Roseburia sp.]
MVTIKDIARESGYSVSTVSRVLNHKNDVSAEAQQRIVEVVERFHFVPNNNAKHLKQTNSRSIGVLVRGISNMLFASIVEELQKRVEKTGYTLAVSYLDEDADEVGQALTLCRERKPLGLLFLGGNPEHFDRSFSQIQVPAVLVTNRADHMDFPNLSSVATDDVEAGKCAVGALLDAGHRAIGILGGDLANSYTSRQRFLGCEQGVKERGLHVELCYEKARFSYESAYQGARRLMEQEKGLTAIFAMSDIMAVGAVRALFDMGFRVPEDVSVVGFDGTEMADYYHPRLATVKQQYQILAGRSMDILLDRIETEEDTPIAVHEIVPFTFVEGESIKNIK